MAITYPLSIPSGLGVAQASLRAINAVAYDQSPFTFAGQAQASAGQAWAMDLTFPPMTADKAEALLAFLISLRGQFGTFTAGDPRRCRPRGSLSSGATVTVYGAGQTGQDLTIATGVNSTAGVLLAGDYIQLGAGSSARLHKLLTNADTNSNGRATVSVWPNVRLAPANGATVVAYNPVGLWRLDGNETEWTNNEFRHYGITISAREAV